MHYAKYGKAAVGSIMMHSERGIDGSDTHEHSNENIDSSRTHLNYDLKDRGGMTAYAYYKQRIDRIAAYTKERTGKDIRKDAVTLCSWVVTAPKDLAEEKQEDFFKGCYSWFKERYGEGNIVTAAVHMDETTPHMHMQFTPILEKDGIAKLCAKDMETRSTLRTAHQKLQKHLEQALGCGVNILNGATEQGNKSILKLQNETLTQQLAEKEQKLQKVLDETNILGQQKKVLQGQIDTLQRDIMTAKQVKDVPHSKALMSDKLLVAPADFDALCKTAALAESLLEEIKPARKINAQAKAILQAAEEKGKDIIKQATEEANSREAISERIRSRKKLEHIEEVFACNPQLLKDFKKTEVVLQNREKREWQQRHSDVNFDFEK